jgi:uncharacterized protein (TIGR00251 family)
MTFIRKHSKGMVFQLFIQPRASKDMIVGLHGDRLKIKVAAPPVDGEANKRCIRFLAKCLSVPRSTLQIISGHNSRNKRVLLKSEQTPPTVKEYTYLKQQVKRLIKQPAQPINDQRENGPTGKRANRQTDPKKALD